MKNMRLKAKVIQGSGRGRGMSIPTLNLDYEPDLKYGVYAARVYFDEIAYAGAMNWGPRPTFLEEEAVMEIHLLDFSGDLYGRDVEVEVLGFIRNIQTFKNIHDLKKQIKSDITQVKKILYNSGNERFFT